MARVPAKLLEIVVKGAKKEDDAAKVARTVIESPLVKTAVYGEDPNWGRVVAAAGRAGVKFDPNAVSLWISDGKKKHPLVKSGEIIADLKKAKEAMHGKEGDLYPRSCGRKGRGNRVGL